MQDLQLELGYESVMGDLDFEEGNFYHRVTGARLNIVYDGEKVFITYFDVDGTAQLKNVCEPGRKTRQEIVHLLREFERDE